MNSDNTNDLAELEIKESQEALEKVYLEWRQLSQELREARIMAKSLEGDFLLLKGGLHEDLEELRTSLKDDLEEIKRLIIARAKELELELKQES